MTKTRWILTTAILMLLVWAIQPQLPTVIGQALGQIVAGCVGTTQNCRSFNIDSNGNLTVVGPAAGANVKIVDPAPLSVNVSNVTGTMLPTASLLFNWNGANWVPVNTTDKVTVVGNGTAGTPDTSPLTVQGIASGTPISAAIATTNSSGTGQAVITCSGYAFDRSSTGDVSLVAISGSTAIYVCGYRITGESTTASDVSLEYGTGATCGTGTNTLTPPTTLGTSTSGAMIGGVAIPPGIWSGLKTPAAQRLCVHRSAAQTSEVEVWYAQF